MNTADQKQAENNRHFSLPEYEMRELNDYLDREQLARGVAATIINAKPPCTLAVTGEWGTGKTVFMRLLEKQLQEMGHKTIWFDLWKYEPVGNSLFALAQCVAIEAKDTDENTRSFLKAAALVGSAGINLLGLLANQKELAELGTKALKDGAGLADVGRLEWSPQNTYHCIAQLEEGFNRAIKRIIEQSAKLESKPRVVILIDDIDRCFPQNISALLTGIKNYLNSYNCCFVMAVDKTRAEAAIDCQIGYSGTAGNWLEKLFAFEIALPVPSKESYQNLISKEVEQFLIDDEQWLGLRKEIIETLTFIASQMPPNPRKLRRLISDVCFFIQYHIVIEYAQLGMKDPSQAIQLSHALLKMGSFILALKLFYPKYCVFVCSNVLYLTEINISPKLNDAMKLSEIAGDEIESLRKRTVSVTIQLIKQIVVNDDDRKKWPQAVIKNMKSIGLLY